MAVSSPGRKLQLTLLTATWPPKQMVRSRVSSVRAICETLGFAREILSPPSGGESKEISALVADRNVHVLDLELADRIEDGPGDVRIDPDLEVIHALQRLVVLLAEHHLALGCVELHALHGRDQLLGGGRILLVASGEDGN